MRRVGRGRAWVGAWLLVVGLTGAPFPLLVFTPPVDGSWLVGLDLVARDHLAAGSHVVFSYGPLGFLANPVYFYFSEWALSLVTICLTHAALTVCAAVFLRQRKAPWPLWLLTGAALWYPIFSSLFADGESLVLAPLLLAVALKCASRRWQTGLVAASSLLMALLAYVKESSMAWGVATLAGFTLVVFLRGRRRLAWIGLASYVGGLALWWLGTGQRLSDWPRYLHGAWEVTAGYVAALGTPAPDKALLVLAAAVLAGFCLGTVVEWLVGRRSVAELLLLFLPILLLAWKDDFVRAGGERTGRFFAIALVVVAFLSADIWCDRARRDKIWRLPVALTVAGLAMVVVGTTNLAQPLLPPLGDKPALYGRAFRLLVDGAARAAEKTQVQERVRAQYNLSPGAVALLRRGSADMFPWDIEVAYGYGLAWEPHPVLQSYTAYTSYLDGLDASYFASARRANHVLYADEAIDDRYQPFDEPAAFRNLLFGYAPVAASGPFLILGRRLPVSRVARGAGSTCAGLGHQIAVPAERGRYVFAAVDVGYSPLGAVMRTVFKPGELHIGLTLRDGTHHTFRLLQGTARDGLLVSGYLGNAQDARNAFLGRFDHPISALTVTANAPSEYRSSVCVTFQSVAASG